MWVLGIYPSLGWATSAGPPGTWGSQQRELEATANGCGGCGSTGSPFSLLLHVAAGSGRPRTSNASPSNCNCMMSPCKRSTLSCILRVTSSIDINNHNGCFYLYYSFHRPKPQRSGTHVCIRLLLPRLLLLPPHAHPKEILPTKQSCVELWFLLLTLLPIASSTCRPRDTPAVDGQAALI